mgnify:CR=1 FL=1
MADLLKSAKHYYFYFISLGFYFSAGLFCCFQNTAKKLSGAGSC